MTIKDKIILLYFLVGVACIVAAVYIAVGLAMALAVFGLFLVVIAIANVAEKYK